jgi:AraC-like DNA-binding protein
MAIFVSKRMGRMMGHKPRPGLERSCKPPAWDWMRAAPMQPGLERIEAFFTGHAYDPHRHDTYAIGYTVHGVQAFHYRGARTASSTGHAMVIHPDEKHDGESGVAAGFRYRMLYLAPRLVRDALGDRAQALPFARAAVAEDPRLIRALRPAFDDMDRPLEELLAIAEALLARDPSAGRPKAMAAGGVAIERARQFLDAHFGRAVTSHELEAVADLDRFTLARQFRKRLGTSPYRYLTMRRLDRARAAITAGLPLAEAAIDCGFADQSHMTRQFKQAYGVSPGRWQALRARQR